MLHLKRLEKSEACCLLRPGLFVDESDKLPVLLGHGRAPAKEDGVVVVVVVRGATDKARGQEALARGRGRGRGRETVCAACNEALAGHHAQRRETA